jgi:hypothetical protein
MWRAHDRRSLRQPRTRGPALGFTGQSMARRARQAAIVKSCDALFRSLPGMRCTFGFMFSDRSIRYCSDTDCNSASRPPIIGPLFAAGMLAVVGFHGKISASSSPLAPVASRLSHFARTIPSINLRRGHSVPRTQRSAQRCAAEPGSIVPLAQLWVPALRSSVKDVAPRPGDGRNVLPPHSFIKHV